MPPNKALMTKKKWGLLTNPFPKMSTTLTADDQEFVFTGQNDYLEDLCNQMNRPGGFFLYGMHGAGKTLFLQRSLATLEAQGYLCTYISFTPEEKLDSLVLLGLVEKLAEEEPDGEYAELYAKLLGKNVKISQEKAVEGGGEISAPFAKLGAKGSSKQTTNIEQAITNPGQWLTDTIKKHAKTRPIIVAIDDLDNQEAIFRPELELDKPEVSWVDLDAIVMKTRQLINVGATVILVGHPSGLTAALGSSNILNRFGLVALDEDDLIQMLKCYLALGRDDGKRELKLYPFTEKAAQVIAKTVTRFRLPTRNMLFICSELYEYCAREGIEVIDETVIQYHWPNVTSRLMGSLKSEDLNYLRVIEEYGGYDEDNDSAIREIAGSLSEFLDGLKKLKPLVEKEYLIENVKGAYKLNPLLAAQNPFDPATVLPEPDDMDAGDI